MRRTRSEISSSCLPGYWLEGLNMEFISGTQSSADSPEVEGWSRLSGKEWILRCSIVYSKFLRHSPPLPVYLQ